ncbi:MAG: ABC transporter substrate-binding protein [Chloroflexi bacterium]|nr:ABC transporter substrate-binding protein [Chloroflexota bacterium]
MKKFKMYPVLVAILLICFMFAACTPAATEAPTEEAPAEVVAPTEAPAEVVAPTEVPPTEAPVVAAYETVKYEAPDCEYGGNMKSMESIDQYTVKFAFCNPDPAFMAKVAVFAFPILDSDYLDETGGDAAKINENPIGTGPYVMQEWVRGDHITFVPSETYWGEKAKNDTFILKWGTEAAARLLDLQSGNVDGIVNVATDDYPTVKADETIALYPRVFNNFLYLGLNNLKEPFTDETVRQAFAMAIDKQRLVDNFYPEGASAATQFAPPGVVPGHNPDYSSPAYDPAKAKEMLESVGFDFTQTIELSYAERTRPYFPQPTKIAQDIQAQFAEIGINVTLSLQEWAAYLPYTREGNAQMFLLGWSEDYPDATNWYDVYLMGTTKSTGDPWPDIMEEVKIAARLGDPAERQAHYDIVNQLIDQHVPYIVLANGSTADAFSKDVQNVIVGPYNENYQEMSTPDGILVYSQDGEPVSLDCADETDGSSFTACMQLFDTLFEFTWGTSTLQPALAEDCVPNADATEYTCHLRQGVVFSNGAAFDANDVIASFYRTWDYTAPNRLGNTGSYSYWKDFFGPKVLNQPAE